jgi:hypothetical protein
MNTRAKRCKEHQTATGVAGRLLGATSATTAATEESEMKTRRRFGRKKKRASPPSFSAARVCESLIGPADVNSQQSILALGLGTAPVPGPYNFETISKLWN